MIDKKQIQHDTKEVLNMLDDKFKNASDEIDFIYDNKGNILKDNKPYIIIKQNEDNNIYKGLSDDAIILDLQDEYLQRFKAYIKSLNQRLKQDLTNVSEDRLKELIKANNIDFLDNYIYLNRRCYDLLDKVIKENYIFYVSRAIADLQVKNIFKYCKAHNLDIEDFLTKVNIDTDKIDLTISKEDLKQVQFIVKEQITLKADTKDDLKEFIDAFNLSDIEFLLNDAIFSITQPKQTEYINKKVNDNLDYYKSINKYYKQINKLLKQITNKYKDKLDELTDVNNLLPQMDKKNKPYPLIATKLFNGNIVNIGREFNLNSVNGDRHKDPINITISIDEDKLNDFSSLPILADLGQQNKIALLPIDLPLFIAFTKINSINGGNKPITLEDAFNDIVESKEVRLRKSNKSYDIYQDRLLYLDRLNMVFSIVDAKTKNNIYTLKDPTPLLANSRVLLNSNKKTAYIIGASAIITLIKALNKIYGVDFLASYNIDKKYINDNQPNTIEIINMKYYLLPKVLQYGNSKKRLDTAQNLINLEDLYTSTAILKGKQELSKKDKETLKGQVNTYLNHLINKGLISDYSYASDKNKRLSVDNLKLQKQRDIKYIRVK